MIAMGDLGIFPYALEFGASNTPRTGTPYGGRRRTMKLFYLLGITVRDRSGYGFEVKTL